MSCADYVIHSPYLVVVVGAVTFKEFGAWLKDYESKHGMAGAVDSKTSVSSDTSRLSRRLKKAKKMAKMGKNEILQLNHAG